MKEMQGLTIVVPVFNEQECIGDTLIALGKILNEVSFDWEVIVVDDGSSDDTEQTLKRHQKERFKIVIHNENKGYGAAVLTGILEARFRHVAITDADGTYPVKIIPDLYHKALKDGFDMVVGARTGSNVMIPVLRKPAKWIIGKLANYVTGRVIPDINSGLRLFNRRVALLFRHLYPSGFSLTTTMTLAMMTNGYSVGYVPINYFQRAGKSKIRPVSDTLNFIKLIAMISLYFAPLRLFLPLSFCLVLAGVAWGIGTYVIFGKLADMSTLLLILAGINAGTVGLLAELVNHRTAYQYEKKKDDYKNDSSF